MAEIEIHSHECVWWSLPVFKGRTGNPSWLDGWSSLPNRPETTGPFGSPWPSNDHFFWVFVAQSESTGLTCWFQAAAVFREGPKRSTTFISGSFEQVRGRHNESCRHAVLRRVKQSFAASNSLCMQFMARVNALGVLRKNQQ